MADGHKDYSGIPLWRKLGTRDHARVVTIGSPSIDGAFQGCQFVVRLRDRPR